MHCLSPIYIPSKYRNDGTDYKVRCKKCLHCRIALRVEWANRCKLESLTKPALFGTLTYRDDEIPFEIVDGIAVPVLVKKDLIDFFKRLRKNSQVKLKHYSCGEYGQYGRPHFHFLLFGIHQNYNDYKGCRKTADQKIAERMQKGGASTRDITLFKYQISDIRREIERAWQYKGTVDIQTPDDGAFEYVTGHNTKYLVPENQGDYQVKTSQQEFGIKSPGLGFDFVDRQHVPTLKRHNIVPYQHPNMITDTGRKPVIVESIDRTKVNGKNIRLPDRLHRRAKDQLGGDIRSEHRKHMDQKYRDQVAQMDMVRAVGREAVTELEQEKQARREKIERDIQLSLRRNRDKRKL